MKNLYFILLFVFFRALSIAQVNTFDIDSSKLNRPLMLVLDTIYKDDQGSRTMFTPGSRTTAAVMDSLIKVAREKDVENQAKVEAIISKYGWLGPQDGGMTGSQALFLVIQHADLPVQEKYLPMVREAVKDGKTLSSNLALLEDRINMRNGKDQVYGSQIFNDKINHRMAVYPIADPDHIDELRKTMGLQPMAEYCKIFKINWNAADYKKALPELREAARKH